MILKDKRVGDTCYINSKDVFAYFSADLNTFEESHSQIDNAYLILPGHDNFSVNKQDFSIGQLKTTFYVSGKTYDEVSRNSTKLVDEAKQCTINVSTRIAFFYECLLTSYSVAETEIEGYNEVTLQFDAIKHTKQVKIESTIGISSPLKFVNAGTVKSGMRIEVMPVATPSIISIAINMMQVRILQQISTYVIIDGIHGTVTLNGLNFFDKTTLTSFPKVLPGDNVISVNKEANIRVTYSPTFLM